MIFRDIVVSPYTTVTPPRGGPDWPDFETQVEARHCQGGVPVDLRPEPVKHKATIDRAAWGGLVVGHFGHAIADHSMRLLPTINAHGQMPLLFAGNQIEKWVTSLDMVTIFQHQVWDWLGVRERRLVTVPTLVRELVVEPQSEQLGGPGASSEHLDVLDALTKERLGTPDPLPAVYVSRAGRPARIAGEVYIERQMLEAGVLVLRPESFNLATQMRFYAAAEQLIVVEGSAIHAMQLLGRSLGDVTVILTHSRPFGRYILEPRARSVQLLNAFDGIVTRVADDRPVITAKGLTVLDPERLCSQLMKSVPNLYMDEIEFQRERDEDVIEWLSSRDSAPTRVPAQYRTRHKAARR